MLTRRGEWAAAAPGSSGGSVSVRTMAVVNQKGGCGKTTTAINLAAIYARRGLRTLLVDMDPQAHCAAGLGVPESRLEYSLADALTTEPVERVNLASLVWEVGRDFDLAPSTMRLAALEAAGGGLHELPGKDRRLARLLDRLAPRYDRCLIDCPPTIGLLTFNALRAAREVIIPVETGFFSLQGAEKQWITIQRTIQRLDRPIAVHMLVTMFDASSHLAREILATLKRKFAGQLLPVIVREHESLREAASFGQPVVEYAPDSPALADFNKLADWLEEHAVGPEVEIEVLADVRELPAPGAEGIGGGEGVERRGGSDGAHDPGRIGPSPTEAGVAGGRAAELAARVRGRGRAAPPLAAALDAGQAVHDADMPAVAVEECPAAEVETAKPELAPVRPIAASCAEEVERAGRHGATLTADGVLFSLPAELGRHMAVAGDFNAWSMHANPLSLDAHRGVHQALLAVPPGRYQYRLIIDGRWVADPFNERQVMNSFGEPNSVLEVPDDAGCGSLTAPLPGLEDGRIDP